MNGPLWYNLKELSELWFQYDATIPGGHGGGGEYEIQLGFGWTNGVIMELLHHYGNELTVRDKFDEEEIRTNMAAAPLSSVGQMVTTMLVLIATFAAGCIGWGMYENTQYPDYISTKVPVT